MLCLLLKPVTSDQASPWVGLALCPLCVSLCPQGGAVPGAVDPQDQHPAAQPGAAVRGPPPRPGPQPPDAVLAQNLQRQPDHARQPRVRRHCGTNLRRPYVVLQSGLQG